MLGTGGHAAPVAEAAISMGFAPPRFIEVGFAADLSFTHIREQLGPVELQQACFALGVGNNYLRQKIYEYVTHHFPQAIFPVVVHKTAWVSPTAAISAGCVVLSHASVCAGAQIETGGLINTGASLDHDSVMEAFCSLGPGARTAGHVRIGQRTMIGLQSAVLPGTSIGNDSAIGAHSLVSKDFPALSVGVGIPCRVTRSRTRDEKH